MPSTHPVFVTGRDPISPLAIHLGLSQNRVPMGAPQLVLAVLGHHLMISSIFDPISARSRFQHPVSYPIIYIYIYIYLYPQLIHCLLLLKTPIFGWHIYIYHTYVHPYMHACIQTLHDITLHCIALHCITLHCIALHYITLHCITLHTYIYMMMMFQF